jgi:sugar phosphate isomerase/epimerase
MHWSLNTYGTGQEVSLERLIELAKGAGYDGIEYLMDFNQPHGVEADASAERLAEVKRQMDAAGLAISCVTSCAYFHDLDPDKLAENLRKARRTIAIASGWGVPQIRVLGDRVPEDETKEQVLEQVAGCLRDLCGEAQDAGVRLTQEMHSSFADPSYSVPMVGRVNHPNFGLIFNGQFRGGGERNPAWGVKPGESIRGMYDRFRPHLVSMHLHAMEPPDVLGHHHELFALLKADDWDGWVSQESAYRGPDPEKVLRMYTAMFQILSA